MRREIIKLDGLAGRRPGFKDYLTRGESFEGLLLARDPSPSLDVPL
jgi:hypothetical protein